jgi:hypothetical protein
MSEANAPGVLTHSEGPDTAAAAPVDEVAAATPADAGNRSPKTADNYKAEVNALLDAYEAKQARIAQEKSKAPPPEPEGLREGESWDSIYASQPPEVKRAMAEMRKMMTRKTQELSRERKMLEAQQAALTSSGLMEQLAQQSKAGPEDFDPFNPEHINAAIEAKVAARLQEVLAPMAQQHQQREAVNRYEAFKAEHPDLTGNPDVKQGVFEALQSDPNLKLEAAYWMVKGKMLSKQRADDAAKAQVRQRAIKRAATIASPGVKPGRQVITPDLKDASAWDIYNELKKQRA